jgi:sterol desaturase/sphingolipid hydroxylase (fatty acid hydroxylase superfamily)
MARGRHLGGALLLATLSLLLWAERRRPLRRRTDPAPTRPWRNVAVGAITAVTVSALEHPVTRRLTQRVERRRLGLAPRLPLPRVLQDALAILLMDYTLYVWHVLLHRVPLLWRLHLPHHADLDLDATTALRFHALEFVASIPWRAAQIVLIGTRPGALAAWQELTGAEVMFHHANLRLPLALDRALRRLVMTPRLHGIHHSTLRAQRDTDYSSGLTLWDRLHGTYCEGIPQNEIAIGLPQYRDPRAVTLVPTLLLPLDPEIGDRPRSRTVSTTSAAPAPARR